MKETIQENTENVLKCENFENLVNYVKTVEQDNTLQILNMINKDFQTIFTIDSLIFELDKKCRYSDSDEIVHEDLERIHGILQRIKSNLLNLLNQSEVNQCVLDNCFQDSKLIYHSIKSNKELSS